MVNAWDKPLKGKKGLLCFLVPGSHHSYEAGLREKASAVHAADQSCQLGFTVAGEQTGSSLSGLLSCEFETELAQLSSLLRGLYASHWRWGGAVRQPGKFKASRATQKAEFTDGPRDKQNRDRAETTLHPFMTHASFCLHSVLSITLFYPLGSPF